METPQNELNENLRTMFSFPKTSNEKADEAIHAFASTAHLLANMVIRTGTRVQEGSEAIKYLDLAFTYFRIGQERKPVEKDENQTELDLKKT
jgi:hypothetical protein